MALDRTEIGSASRLRRPDAGVALSDPWTAFADPQLHVRSGSGQCQFECESEDQDNTTLHKILFLRGRVSVILCRIFTNRKMSESENVRILLVVTIGENKDMKMSEFLKLGKEIVCIYRYLQRNVFITWYGVK